MGPKNGDSIGDLRGSNLNLSWGKCGVWLVIWWILSPCVFLRLSVHSTLRVWCGDFLLLITIFIWDIDMLIILIDSLDCLSILILLLPWLSCSFWHVCSHFYISCCLSVDSFACILSWSSLSMLSLLLFILIVIFSFSLCVDMDDILALYLIACCMTALLLCDCMLLVYVGRIPIPLPPTL